MHLLTKWSMSGRDFTHCCSLIWRRFVRLCFSCLCSTIISWGKSREKDAFECLLDQFPSGPVAVVSDSYDIFKACKHIWGDKLKEKVMERSEDSPLIIRPDSGDPAQTLIEVCIMHQVCSKWSSVHYRPYGSCFSDLNFLWSPDSNK